MEADEKMLMGFMLGLFFGLILGAILKDRLLGGGAEGVMFERDERGRIIGIFTVPIKKGG